MKYAQPMLAADADLARLVPLAENDDYWFEQKADGHRCLMHIEDGTVRAVTRNGNDVAGMSPFVVKVFRDLPGRWVFDGEYVQGVFHVFDLIEGGGVDFRDKPYEERRGILERFFINANWTQLAHVKLLSVARTHQEKCDLAALLYSQNCEGVVAKERSSKYVAGVGGWFRLKFKNTVDAVVMAVGQDGKANVVVGVYRDGVLTSVGECTALAGDGRHTVFQKGDVLEITYQYASEAGKLVQPTMPRLRNDKDAHDCVWEQLVFGSKSVVAL